MSLINQSGILGLATRLQRLSELLRKDVREICRSYDIDFEPKWFPVIYVLHLKEELSVVEIAAGVGFAHPSTISLLKELEEEKLIRSFRDKEDTRKRLIRLTAKGKRLVERLQPVWATLTEAVIELTDTQNNLMKAVEEVEAALAEKSFLVRVLEKH